MKKVKRIWNNKKVRLIIATNKSWWAIKEHFGARRCIVDKKDIINIKKGMVLKKYRKYLIK